MIDRDALRVGLSVGFAVALAKLVGLPILWLAVVAVVTAALAVKLFYY